MRASLRINFSFFVMFLLFGQISNAQQNSENLSSPRDILVALYNSTNGANWTNKTGWLGAPGTECSWFGISCENGQVVHINLRQNNLTGTLPAQLGNLVSLRTLDLGGNSLTGTIPTALGNLSNLTGIWVWGNQLSGAIPTELGSLAQLRNINFGGNNLSGSIPSSLGALSNLLELDLSNNQLIGPIPAQIGNLTAATTINLRNNLLSGDVPASVSALGSSVNLWANIALNIPKGNPAACVADAQNPLALNGTTQGTLTPFTDCYVEDANAMVDFYQIDLSAASGTTQLQIQGNAAFFSPHIGILGGTIGTQNFDDRDVMQTRVGPSPFSVEVALAPGKYTLYLHGGAYNHDKNVNVPATGTYSLTLSTINELQKACPKVGENPQFNRTWVTKGTGVSAALSADDCLDKFAEPFRLFDSYAIYLEQGESVLVTLESEIATQLLSFAESGFISASSGAASVKHGLTLTAQASGWHRFAPYNPTNNALATGAYTIRFMEPPVFGVSSACTTGIPSIALGGQVSGALSNSTDCFAFGRLRDLYALNITEPTLFRADVQTQGLMPFMGIYPAGNADLLLGSRIGTGNSTQAEFYLSPGQYWFFVASRFQALDTAIEGSYTLSLGSSLPLTQLQTGGCAAGDTRLVIGGATTIGGAITQGDCPDTTDFGSQTNNPERDGYQVVLPAGTVPLQVSLTGDFNTRLSIFRNGVFVSATTGAAGQSSSQTLTEGGSYQINVLGQQGPSNGGTADRGNYTLKINSSGVSANSAIVQIAFSYTFSGSSNSGQVGVSDHVLTGVVDAVMLADGDTFEVRGLRSASLGGAAYTVGNMPGIVARRSNQPALMSLSGNRLDVQICPSGFTAGNDCPFGTEGGFLISDAWPATGSQAGQGGALAGHPQFGGSYRDRDIPINKARWSAQLYTPSVPQRDILLALYNSTNGANWTNKTGWLGAPGTECSWFGVGCQNGHVVSINLQNNNLSGVVPTALTQLNNLTVLNLANNGLTGSLPVFSNSVAVNASGNPLGVLPAQQVYLNSAGNVFKGMFNNLPIFYDVTDDDATLTGLGVHIHYSSSQVDSIAFANLLTTSLLAADATGTVDSSDLDNDPRTDRYITIGWSDLSGNWPGSLPRKLFDLRVKTRDAVSVNDPLVLNFSRTSNTTGYSLQLPRLNLNVINASLDVDGNGKVEALSDALMIIRNLFGFSGAALIDRAVASNATFATVSDIQARLLAINAVIDVDGNGTVDALTDGLMIMRYMFGFRGSVLIANAVGSNAQRSTAESIEQYLAGLVPPEN